MYVSLSFPERSSETVRHGGKKSLKYIPYSFLIPRRSAWLALLRDRVTRCVCGKSRPIWSPTHHLFKLIRNWYRGKKAVQKLRHFCDLQTTAQTVAQKVKYRQIWSPCSEAWRTVEYVLLLTTLTNAAGIPMAYFFYHADVRLLKGTLWMDKHFPFFSVPFKRSKHRNLSISGRGSTFRYACMQNNQNGWHGWTSQFYKVHRNSFWQWTT
jgi:hypothetical protein